MVFQRMRRKRLRWCLQTNQNQTQNDIFSLCFVVLVVTVMMTIVVCPDDIMTPRNCCSFTLLPAVSAFAIPAKRDDVLKVNKEGDNDPTNGNDKIIQRNNSNNNFKRRKDQSLWSRLQTAQCELLVSVGRIPGTAMPSEWAASGARLGFPLEVEFTDEACVDAYQILTKERLLGGSAGKIGTGRGGGGGDEIFGSATTIKDRLRVVDPLNEPTFISNRGQETIQVKPGAYTFQLQQVEAQQYKVLFFMDFPKGAKRNDVELPAERIYFITSCWIQNDRVLDRAEKRVKEIENGINTIQKELQELSTSSSSSSGSGSGSSKEARNENGPAGFIKKAMNFRASIPLVERKATLESQLAEMYQTYPLQKEKLVEGPNGTIFVQEGIIAVKRFRGAMETREQYHWVGTFKLTDFFEDEYEDEDEDEDIE